MASTPSSRIKLTPSNSPFLTRPSRSPLRPRGFYEPCLSLQRVVGTTCSSPTGFDTVHSSFAYIAGGAVVVVDVSGEHYSQRFYRARPNAVSLLAASPVTNTSSTPISTPKANDSRNRVAASPRESLYASSDWPESPASKTWTSRERIKAATCLGLSRDGRYLAVGETGYAPRVLIFNLQDASSDTPLVSISEHTFGVKAVAWSPDTKYLASLGAANDGSLYLWKVDSRTGAVKLFQQNRCTSSVKGMVWMGNSVITLGVRHVKVWRVEDGLDINPPKPKFPNDGPVPVTPQAQKPLPGRNILLGSMLDATFSCALPVSDEKAIICSETGCVCLLDDTNKQMKLVKVLEVGFSVTCITSQGPDVHIGGKEGQLAVISLDSILLVTPEPTVRISEMAAGFVAMGFLAENLVTIDTRRSIDIWSAECMPGNSGDDKTPIPIPGLGDPIVGIQRLSASNTLGASFFTWSGAGKVTIWNLDGMIKSSFDIPIEQPEMGPESGPDNNQVVVVRATDDGSLFVAGDRLGVLRIVEVSTGECLLETKAHSSNCQDITLYEGKSRFLVASCGRDRTVQLFHRSSAGGFEHFQTLEFTAKVVKVLIPSEDKVLTCSFDRTLQIHELVSKEGEPDVMAAIPSKVISLKASPSSMTVTPDEKAIFVSLLDRSVGQYDFANGRLLNSFKCNDEAGLDSVVLESLTYSQLDPGDQPLLLGISNTDKSVRLYDAQAGYFMDREWGHTEAINGVILIDSEDAGRKVVSVGEDGTIMIWALDFQDPTGGSRSRDPSPEKTSQPASTRPPLRRVLSKAELAEFQRPSTATTTTGSNGGGGGRRSPPRLINRRPSKFLLPLSSLRTPTTDKHQPQQQQQQQHLQTSPVSASPSASAAIDDSPSRRASSGAGSRSDDSPPPESPKARSNKKNMFRRPSLPALGVTPSSTTKSRKNSSSNQRGSGSAGNGNAPSNGYGFGSLSMATEQTCRQLRAYRKKLAASAASASAVADGDVLAQLDAELRLTAAALGERAIRSRTTGNGGGNGNHHHHHHHHHNQQQRGGGHHHHHRERDGGGGGGGKGVSETVLSGLLDQYSERLVTMLDEKLRLRLSEEEKERPRTAGEGSTSGSCGGGSLGGGTVCEEPESV
ncbi:quinon protein alcohol dehydrogenase-like superfamily [Chaetomidium leptoderma]|uniref:Quinon protein alcohol dehydrogenase-like superfamily n=1 Tax=Chaetomidium leptoderma TaxID=669021 RepID=A0AAN6VM61_9PEZI|nr:quinon protein alcohol dehydrogenase-like superfamily [Chaetomidium leptoderma]